MASVAILNFLFGLVMYWQLSGFRPSFLYSGYGLYLTLGGVAGLLGLIAGFALRFRNTQRMKALGAAIGASAGPPTAEQQTEMRGLGQAVARGAQITTFLLVLAWIGMSVAQYAGF